MGSPRRTIPVRSTFAYTPTLGIADPQSWDIGFIVLRSGTQYAVILWQVGLRQGCHDAPGTRVGDQQQRLTDFNTQAHP
jgi:hypothetical protein